MLDRRFGIFERKNTLSELPTVDLGAAVRVDNADELAPVVEALMNRDSDLSMSLKKNMDTHYRPDGKNTERVTQVITSLLEK